MCSKDQHALIIIVKYYIKFVKNQPSEFHKNARVHYNFLADIHITNYVESESRKNYSALLHFHKMHKVSIFEFCQFPLHRNIFGFLE